MKPLYSALLWLLLCAPAGAEALQWYAVPADPAPSAPLAASPAVGNEPAASAAPKPMSSSAQRYRPLIDDVARQHALDPMLIHAVVQVESAYRPEAVSGKGAVGLMQLMPATAARFGQTALYDPRANLQAGAAYLNWLMNRFGGRLDLALAAYNAGEGAVARYGNAIPPYAETRDYVRKVMAHYAGLKGEAGAAAADAAPVPAPAGRAAPRAASATWNNSGGFSPAAPRGLRRPDFD
ncbi:lytic transglycosylase domain-containing protein [Chromobacterium vaccinii]|uniref:lytic transglycosylase domain-containing protein n=1 Tax=Chromobacterium vaccinii TaxID=1108595 RepID=UPI000E119236|nr:lytic transglycosylase domain-containing protein [Chromobacterium vaccinii]SUX56109.1 Soluble lytic murein transglycosylase precursor [Chromobacterium vaccinii]